MVFSRKELFNSTLLDIMMRKELDSYKVEELIPQLNARHQASLMSTNKNITDITEDEKKSFSAVEVNAYLKQLHEEGRIFMVWEDGTMGTLYQI